MSINEVLATNILLSGEKIVLDMKGMYLKNAQLVSTRDEFLPPQYMEFCKRMQDQVPSELPKGEAARIVEQELGRPLNEVFEWFDHDVYGAASIGQVSCCVRVHGRCCVLVANVWHCLW